MMDVGSWMVSFAARRRLFSAFCRSLCLCAVGAAGAYSQVVDFESNGLHYQALTKNGVTVMFAKLPPHISNFNVMQVAVTNGSPVSWVVKPEDFQFIRPDNTSIRASTAEAVVSSLLSHASRGDVVKLQLMYEATIYALGSNYRSTNGYEQRREASMTLFINPRFKAAAAASAVTFAPTKLKAGDSTDGAIFFPNREKTLGPGRLIVHEAGEDYQFDVFGDLTQRLK